ncbi:unnamed protein product [Musa acuminata subsp. malaccensis]|uniref:(wild Malaysian banana) hypothetical protein n=1 Tax=Musa acuminata subsp. malaccensis TaxID=214687 RepID=A0A804JEW1_MUSAM|nr:unnamed protein product [Musa acuminata subsp. malaccensis]
MVTIVRDIMGIAGNAVSLGLFLSRVPTFKNIIKKKAVEQYLPIPELTILFKCMLWVLYGLPIVHPNSCLVLTSNAIGLFLQAVYLTIFLIYAAREIRLKVLKVLAAELVVMTMLVVVVLQVAHTHEKRSLIVGIPCVIFGSCMYAAPLAFLITSYFGAVLSLVPPQLWTWCLMVFCTYDMTTLSEDHRSSPRLLP